MSGHLVNRKIPAADAAEQQLAVLQQKLGGSQPQDILQAAYENFADALLAFSGAEDVVLIDMALKVSSPERLRIFTLDSGRLHPETYRFVERVNEHYGVQIEMLSPETRAVESLVREKGLFSFYRDGHQECCSIRKVAPLRRRLADCSAWITGQRRDQNPGTRSNAQEVELDENNASSGQPLLKFNPLARWSKTQVWEYIRMFDVPYNELHDRGFISIGCAPCTRPVNPGQHEREGRWWWEETVSKECGLHGENASGQPPAPSAD